MKERPILFSAPMVRAILDGSKTQTRRVIKPQPENLTYSSELVTEAWKAGEIPVDCPHGDIGDRLWVRENLVFPRYYDNTKPSEVPDDVRIFYPADDSFRDEIITVGEAGKTRPGIFMPRWASRITLEITAVRVERLNEISPYDAEREGINCHGMPLVRNAQQKFSKLWESINGAGSWALNPWVWVVEFKKAA